MRRFKRRLLLRTLLGLVLSMLVIALLLFIADGVMNNLLANLLSTVNRRFYVFLRSHKIEVILVVFALSAFISIWITLTTANRYIDMLADSIGRVFEKDEKLIKLPADFAELEDQLNTIKYNALRNEQLAKEAEQRKNDLVVYLAHDLKTPLTSVIGYLSLLNEEKDISPELRDKYQAIALEKAQRLETLINEFFEITRFNLQNISLERGRIQLSVLLEQLADEFDPLFAQKRITCQTRIAPRLTVNGDADKLARVFDNLLKNAVSYSYENSVIRILADPSDLPVQRPDGQTAGRRQGVLIRFQNQGDPIPAHQLQSVFEKFYRLDTARSSRSGGAGLGLAIAKEIVELHGGGIWAASQAQADGEGGITEFAVFLPF
ncbi:MAG: vancomycin resistance histidine kinase VanS [Clostridiales bacterium]|nr:vancomycin resistance histidine kinase VanS [Clostridiales bacterium]